MNFTTKKWLLVASLMISGVAYATNNTLRLAHTDLEDIAPSSVSSNETSEPAYLPVSCAQILSDGNSSGDGLYSIYPSGSEETVFCDMTNDGGGWQLITAIAKSSTPASLQNISDFPSDVTAVGTVDNPGSAFMYKASLERFSAAREGVSCTTSSTCANAYGSDLTGAELTIIRRLTTSTGRSAIMRSQVPNCVNSNGTEKLACDGSNRNGDVYLDSVSGWQGDIYGNSYCWFMRSNSVMPNSAGSGQCQNSGEPNGTRHALLWMR